MLLPDTQSFFTDDEEDAVLLLEQLSNHLRKKSQIQPCRISNNPTTTSHSNLRDLTSLAVWTVSTAKPGNGIEQLLDSNPATYWQSDGPQPHTISAQFSSKLNISAVQLYLDYSADESYTPAIISAHAGANPHDLRLIRKLRKLNAPQGWVTIPLGEMPRLCDMMSEDDESDDGDVELSPEEEAVRNARRLGRVKMRETELKKRQAELDARWKLARRGVNGHLEAMRDHSVTKAHMVQIVIHCNHQNGRDSHVRMVRAMGPQQQVIATASKFSSREFQMYEVIR